MIKKIAVAFLLLTISDPEIYAQKKKRKLRRKPKKLEQVEQSQQSEQTDPGVWSSASVRDSKTAGGGLRAGLIAGSVSGAGLELTYLMGESLQLNLNYLTGEVDLTSAISDNTLAKVDKALIKVNMVYLQARYFIGNSFYLSGGLGQRVVNAELKVSSKISNDAVTLDTTSDSVVFVVNIGNQWSFPFGLTIGIDWLGAAVPVSSSFSSSTKVTGELSSSLEELSNDGEELAEKIGEITSFQAFLFNVGFQF